MTRRVAQLYILTHPQGLTACFCGEPQDPPQPDRCQPVDCESWLDVRAGMELVWPDGKISTVYGIELWSAYPAVEGKPRIVSGRDWERTGLDAQGKPTEARESVVRGEPDFERILKRMEEERQTPRTKVRASSSSVRRPSSRRAPTLSTASPLSPPRHQ